MHPMVRSTNKRKKKGLSLLGGEDSDARMVHSQFSKSSSSDFASRDMQEESLPWGWLPRDILERALALLPLLEVFRLRCVCKRWNDLICCVQFQSRVAWGPFFVPKVHLTAGRGSSVVSWSSYDFGERKWIPMPPLKFPLQFPFQSLGWSLVVALVAAEGGLVCFQSFNGNTAYERDDPRYGKVRLYDSITNTWTCGQDMSVGNRFLRHRAYCNGEFYILVAHRYYAGPYAVVRLQLTTLRWREETIPIPEGCMRCPLIIACLGQVYLVGGRNDTHSYPLPSVVIFQLDQSNKWTKVSEYSDEHFLGFLGEIRGCWSDGLKMHMVAKLEGSMWLGVYNYATSCWEEPIHRGDVLYKLNICDTNFTFHPNFQVVP